MTDKSFDTTQRLLAIEQVHQLKARYCRYLDTKQWHAMSSLFCADARFDGFMSAPSGSDVPAFIRGISTRLQNAITIHHCHMPELRFTDANHARGIWAMMDYLQWPEGVTTGAPLDQSGFFGYGHYEEVYRREDDEWRIAYMRLTRLRIDPLPAHHPRPHTGMLSSNPDWLTADGVK